MGPFCEMVELGADQAFPWLLDMSLSLTQACVIEDPITFQSAPPSVRVWVAQSQGQTKT